MASLSDKAIINSALSKAELIGLNLFFLKTHAHTHTHKHPLGKDIEVPGKSCNSIAIIEEKDN